LLIIANLGAGMRVIGSSNAKLCGRYSVLDSNPFGSHADEKLAGHFDTFRPFEPAQLALNFHPCLFAFGLGS
jgi:hypothetical protein